MQREERDLKNKHRNLIEKADKGFDADQIQKYLEQLYDFTLKNGYIPVPYHNVYSEIYATILPYTKTSKFNMAFVMQLDLFYLFGVHITDLKLEDFEPEIYGILNDVEGSVFNFNNYFKTFLISINSLSLNHDEMPADIFNVSIFFMEQLISNFLEKYSERKEEVERHLVQIKVKYPDVQLLSTMPEKEGCDNIFYDNQVLYKIVREGDLNYCFTKDEYDEYERTGINPYTSKPFMPQNRKQNSDKLFLFDKKMIDKLYRWTDQLYTNNRIFVNFSKDEIELLSKTLPRSNITLYRGMKNFECSIANFRPNTKTVHVPSVLFTEKPEKMMLDDFYDDGGFDGDTAIDIDNVGAQGIYDLQEKYQKCNVNFKTYSSWTYDVKTAEFFADGGVILKRDFSREEILVDLTKVKNRRTQYIDINHESEVIIKPGSYICEVFKDSRFEPEMSKCDSKLSLNIKKLKKLFNDHTVKNLVAKGFDMEKWREFVNILGNPKLKGDDTRNMISVLEKEDILIYDESNLREPQNKLACHIINSITKEGKVWYQNRNFYNEIKSYYDAFFE